MQYIDLMDDYLRGRMSSKEEQKFLQSCKSNPVLKEEAISMACLYKSLRDNRR